MKRALTKRTYPALALVLFVLLPGAAVAAPGEEREASHAALADARPALVAPLVRPVKRFHRAIRVGLRKVRAVKRAERRRERRQRARRRREAFALPAGVSPGALETIASCESGGDPTAVSADGSYRGKYQFSYSTWASVGGSGDPAAAPEAEQDYRAALLYAQAGSSPWPVCG